MMEMSSLNDVVLRHVEARKNTYYAYEWFEKEINDIKERLSLIENWQKKKNFPSLNFLIVEDFGNIILFSEDKMYFFFFRPIDFAYGYDSHSSRELLSVKEWVIPDELKNAIEIFKWNRNRISAIESQNIWDEKNSAMQQYSITHGWRYHYLLLLWKTKHSQYDLFFEYNPWQNSMKGKPYYHNLIESIYKIITPWKKQYLLEHHLVPKEHQRYLLEKLQLA